MIVFVHGVPETAALWDKVRGELGGDSVALSLPGFGCPRPAGFGATKDDYAAWLAAQLAAFDGPVDLVGHDWGAILTYRIATTRGELLRSWVADCAIGVHQDQVWHKFAKVWQTPAQGEAFFENLLAVPVDVVAKRYEEYGLSAHDALTLASMADATMGSCILDLYRSATPNVHASWGSDLRKTTAPGLVLHATEDRFDDDRRSLETAQVLGASRELLEGLGHWWALQDPAVAAKAIGAFHAAVT